MRLWNIDGTYHIADSRPEAVRRFADFCNVSPSRAMSVHEVTSINNERNYIKNILDYATREGLDDETNYALGVLDFLNLFLAGRAPKDF